MDFINNIGSKAAKAGQTAFQKTVTFTEGLKIKNQISSEKKKISEFYEKIGKIYFKKYKTEPAGEFSDIFREIKFSFNKINDYKTQLDELNGTKRCEECGKQNENNAAFCPYCGWHKDE